MLCDAIGRHGFRAVVLDGTDPPFATAAALDEYVTTGVGDPVALLAASQGFLRTAEILDLLHALRARNAEHPSDPVRIVHGPVSSATSLETVEREMAERTLAWHRDTGHRIVHWAGIAHVAAGEYRGLAPSGGTHRSSGGHLRTELGDGYVAVAATVGEVDDGSVPPTPRQFTEAPLSVIDAGWLPVRGVKGPQAVQGWLDGPLQTRLVGPHYDPAADAVHYVTGPSVREAIDGFLYVRRSEPMRPLRSIA
ncbi:erythromycin esterase family protein [Salinifilum ghardaiensis]